MASTITRKRPRTHTKPRVGDLTLDEIRAMMSALIDARLAQWVDPDAGLEPHPEVIARVQRQRAEFAAGKRGKSLKEVASKYAVEL